MNLDEGLVGAILLNSRRFYRKWNLEKKGGGYRIIFQPNSSVRAVQAWILRNVLDRLSPTEEATAYVRGRGLRSNTDVHATHRYFFILDLEDFFPSIRVHRVAHVFRTAGYSETVAEMLATLCTCNGRLPQGAVTSPSLSNLVCIRLDNRLVGMASRRNVAYTRYADDLTFSANTPRVLRRSEPLIRQVLKSERFKVNEEKTRFAGPRVAVRVTGLTRNSSKPGFGIGRRKELQMRAVMHHMANGKQPDERYSSAESIEGWLRYLSSVDPVSHTRMKKYWTSLKSGSRHLDSN